MRILLPTVLWIVLSCSPTDDITAQNRDSTFEVIKERCMNMPQDRQFSLKANHFSVSSNASKVPESFGGVVIAKLASVLVSSGCFRVTRAVVNQDYENTKGESINIPDEYPLFHEQDLHPQAILTGEVVEYFESTLRIMGGSVITGEIKIIVTLLDTTFKEMLWSRTIHGKRGKINNLPGLKEEPSGSVDYQLMSSAAEDAVLRTLAILVQEKEEIYLKITKHNNQSALARFSPKLSDQFPTSAVGTTNASQTLSSAAIPTDERHEKTQAVRKNHALFFCTTQYEDLKWPPLKNPVSDGEALASILHDKYGFDTVVHRNIKLNSMISEIKKTFVRQYNDNDQLFLFFAGHGDFDPLTRMGGIVAYDSKGADAASYLGYEKLREFLSDNHPCKHIFLVIDVCYGGTFFRSVALRGDTTVVQRRGGIPVGHSASSIENIYVREGTRYASRHALTSSGKEPVSDGIQYSPFTEKLLEMLRSSLADFLTTADFEKAIQGLSPVPKLSTFNGHEPGGQFFLFRRN